MGPGIYATTYSATVKFNAKILSCNFLHRLTSSLIVFLTLAASLEMLLAKSLSETKIRMRSDVWRLCYASNAVYMYTIDYR